MATKDSIARLPPINNQEPFEIMSMSLHGVSCCILALFSIILYFLVCVIGGGMIPKITNCCYSS